MFGEGGLLWVGVLERWQYYSESVLPKLAYVSDRAFQKYSSKVKATLGQQYRNGGSWLHRNTNLCTYILNTISGNGLVVLINRPFGYNYDIQPFHPCSVLKEGGGENDMTEKLRLWL